MPLIPSEALPYFENMIYLPMIISILERDRKEIEISSFKLKGPYIKLIEGALVVVKNEMKETNIYVRRNSLKVTKGRNDGTFTEYSFFHRGYEDKRRYLNIRLRNRTEELMSVYFSKVDNPNLKG